MQKLTRDHVIQAVDMLKAAVARWDASDGPIVLWQGAQTKVIADYVEQAANELFEFCAVTDATDDAMPLILRIDELEDAFVAHIEGTVHKPTDTNPQGGPLIWAPYNRILEEITSPRKRRRPDPIQALAREGVSYANIAKQYEWYIEANWAELGSGERTPDIARVQDEIEKPGTHFDPDTWVSAKDLEWREEIRRKWARRCEELEAAQANAQRHTPGPKPQAAKKDAPEPLADLAKLPNMSFSQVCKMKPSMEPDAIAAELQEMGISLEGQPRVFANEYVAAQERQAADDRRRSEYDRLQGINWRDDIEDFDERVWNLVRVDEVKPNDVAQHFGKHLNTVNAAVKRHEKKRETAGT